MKRNSIALLLSVIVLAACSRGAQIESEPGPVYLIKIENPMSHDMDVWYDDGVETTELGRVHAHTTREFVITSPASPSIEIIARDDGRTHSMTRRADLAAGTAAVVLTP